MKPTKKGMQILRNRTHPELQMLARISKKEHLYIALELERKGYQEIAKSLGVEDSFFEYIKIRDKPTTSIKDKAAMSTLYDYFLLEKICLSFLDEN